MLRPRFVSHSGLVYAAGWRRKKRKKKTEHERVQFLLRLNTRGLPYTHAAQATRHMSKNISHGASSVTSEAT